MKARFLFIFSILAFLFGSYSNANAQTEFTVSLHFDASFNYLANVNHSTVTYFCSMNSGSTDINLLRSALLVQGGVNTVTINPATATTYAVTITFKKPMDVDELYVYFKKAHIMNFYCPAGGFHMKDWNGWMTDRLN